MNPQIIYAERERGTGLFDIYADGAYVGSIAECWPNDEERWRVLSTRELFPTPQDAAQSLLDHQ